MFLERSSFRGLWRVLGGSGDPGSFLTMILGAVVPEACRVLHMPVSKMRQELHKAWEPLTYPLSGDDFAGVCPVGLPLPLRCVVGWVLVWLLGVAENAESRGAEGDDARATEDWWLVPIVAGARST